jgi:hypothetical protein
MGRAPRGEKKKGSGRVVLLERRGTVNASLVGATEGIVLLAAAVETILLVGLTLAITGVGTGSVILDPFLRLHDIVLGPFALVPLPGGARLVAIGQRIGAILGYGLFFVLLISGVSWFDRRRPVS